MLVGIPIVQVAQQRGCQTTLSETLGPGRRKGREKVMAEIRLFLKSRRQTDTRRLHQGRKRLDYRHHGVVFESPYPVPHMNAVMDPWPWGTSVCAPRLNENIVILRRAGIHLLGSVSWGSKRGEGCASVTGRIGRMSDRGSLSLSRLALKLIHFACERQVARALRI